MFTLGKRNVLVRFGAVINYSVNCCTTVSYRTEPYSVGSLASGGLVRYGTVRYGTVGTVRYGAVRYARQWQCKHSILTLPLTLTLRSFSPLSLSSLLYFTFSPPFHHLPPLLLQSNISHRYRCSFLLPDPYFWLPLLP